MKFKIHKLHDAFEKKGLSPYMVGKELDIAQNTVKKYVIPEAVTADRIEGTLIKILSFYGLNWRSDEVVEIIEED